MRTVTLRRFAIRHRPTGQYYRKKRNDILTRDVNTAKMWPTLSSARNVCNNVLNVGSDDFECVRIVFELGDVTPV